MARLLITGANGQLGMALREEIGTGGGREVLYTDVHELDITNANSLSKTFEEFKPNFIVNCAAYTAVDRCEAEEELAARLNSHAPGLMAQLAKSRGAKLIHISTDYVFDGRACEPYSEAHPVGPTSAYGRTKLQGEQLALASGACMVIRTSWLYSRYGHNFVKTIASKGLTMPELNVVYDQIGSLTWANDLARAILSITERGEENFAPEVFHYSNEGVCSWYDVAKFITSELGTNCKINPILSSQYPTPAKRPPYSVLNKSKIKEKYGVEIPHWYDSLRLVLGIIGS